MLDIRVRENFNFELKVGACPQTQIWSAGTKIWSTGTRQSAGNLGVGRDPLPSGEDDVVDLEERVSGMIAKYPAIVVCMYDVHKLSGHLIMRGGLQTHSLTVCSDGIHRTPYYVPEDDSERRNHTQ